MADRITIFYTEVGLAREIARLLPVMRARRDITATSGDIGLAAAIAKNLLPSHKVSREVDVQYMDIITRELGPDGFTRG